MIGMFTLLGFQGRKNTATFTEDCVLVLGSGIRGEKILPTLQFRLDKCIEYLQHNPKALIIVSGGKGRNETICESEAMKRYLVSKGVDAERIYEDCNSKNTRENMAFSKMILDSLFPFGNYSVACITSDYHAYRAGKLSEKVDLSISHYNAKTAWYLYPAAYCRETLSIIKMWTYNIISYPKERKEKTVMTRLINHFNFLLIISETKNDIKYLWSIDRDDRREQTDLPFIGKEDFFIRFLIGWNSKKKEDGGNSEYTMHVIPYNGAYKTKLRITSHSYCGVEKGHRDPNLEWSDCDDWLCNKILDYYFAHQSTIPVYTDSKNVDISRWKPLVTTYNRRGMQDHVIKMTKQMLPYGEFYIDIDLLSFKNILVNGELMRYTISSYTLDFIPVKGGYFNVRLRENSSKIYTGKNKEGTDQKVYGDGRFGERQPLDYFSDKILKYYLAHKSEIRTTVENVSSN